MVGNWVVGTTTSRVIEHFKNAGKLNILILTFPFPAAERDLGSSNCLRGVQSCTGP